MNPIDTIKRNYQSMIDDKAKKPETINKFAGELSKRVDEITNMSGVEKLVSRREILAQFVERNPANSEAVELLNLINGFLSHVGKNE